jgi:site-specific DNA-methyltransferase (adenine-specific)
MKFDVIIGNPPYQLSNGVGMKTESASGSAIPLYHKFVQQAQKLNPRYLCMIIPSRWFSGGRGLDDFRERMLSSSCLVNLVDYTDSRDCFPGVDIAGGVCYFLWQKDYEGPCNVCNIYQGKRMNSLRYLNEFSVFIRHSQSIDVIHKVLSRDETTMNEIVYSSKPFGFRSFESGRQTKQSNDIELLGSKGITFVSRNEVQTNADLIYKWKVVMSKASAEHAGQTDQEGRKRIVSKVEVLGPGQICTETYLLLSTFNTEEEAINLKEYVKTRFFRFLLSTILLTQNIAKDKFQFVPFQDFSKPWTDEELYAKYGLTEEEIAFIESMIRPME